MKIMKNYKKLYNEQKNNNKILVERNEDLYKRDIMRQEKNLQEKKELRKEIARLKLELEDVNGFLEQEKAVSKELRKERTKLETQITKQKHNVTPEQTYAVCIALKGVAVETNTPIEQVVINCINEYNKDGENNE